jgi:hypothetical protein
MIGFLKNIWCYFFCKKTTVVEEVEDVEEVIQVKRLTYQRRK